MFHFISRPRPAISQIVVHLSNMLPLPPLLQSIANWLKLILLFMVLLFWYSGLNMHKIDFGAHCVVFPGNVIYLFISGTCFVWLAVAFSGTKV